MIRSEFLSMDFKHPAETIYLYLIYISKERDFLEIDDFSGFTDPHSRDLNIPISSLVEATGYKESLVNECLDDLERNKILNIYKENEGE